MAVASVSRFGLSRRTSGASRSGCGRTSTLVSRSTDCSVSARWRSSSILRRSRRASQLGMTGFGLREAAFRAGELLLHFSRRAADLLVGPLQQFGQRKLDVRADPLDLGDAFPPRLFEKWRKRMLVQPRRRPRAVRDGGQLARRVGGVKLPSNQAPGAEVRRRRELDREQPLVDRPARAHPRLGRGRNRSAPAAHAATSRSWRPCRGPRRPAVGVPPDRLEQRMAGRDPLQVLSRPCPGRSSSAGIGPRAPGVSSPARARTAGGP